MSQKRPTPNSLATFLFPLALFLTTITAPVLGSSEVGGAVDRAPIDGSKSSDRGVVITVGPGLDCDQSDVETAISTAPSGAEVRLENVTFSAVAIGIVSKNLSVIGGFDTCSDATPSFSSTLDGTGNGGNTVVDIFDNVGSRWSVRLENLNIENGAETSPFERGGGVHVEDGIDLELVDVTLRNNTSATDGGGLQLRGFPTSVTILGDTVIANNEAGDGGGIACLGDTGGPGLLVIDRATILSNTASRGGGIFADNCTVETHAGGFLQGILNNTATLSGGGIAALGNSFVQVLGVPGAVPGNPEAAALISGNSAGNDGGGVWAIQGSDIEVVDGILQNNVADRGGAVDVSTGAFFVMRRGAGNRCGLGGQDGAGIEPCPRIRGNRARLVGGAFAVNDGVVDIAQSFLSGNTADLNGSVGEISSGSAFVDSSVLYENAGNQLFRQFANSSLTVRWSTLADNVPDAGSPPLIEVRGTTGTPATTRLYSNVAWNPGRPVYGVDTSGGSLDDVRADCIVAHELTSLPSATRSTVADPLFVDPAVNDYHIDVASPAVDFCDDSVDAPAFADLDDQPRGVDVVPGGSTYDVGADESQGIIFRDGFESG